ncbi:hypothetical protein Tco_0719723, partial [Tanacetum coccineum]
TYNVAHEAFNEEMDDCLERVAATATSLDVEHDRGNINNTQSKIRSENVSKHSNDPLLARGNILHSGEDRLKLKELIEFCTKLQQRVLNLENKNTTQVQEITSLKLRVKKLENKGGSRTHKLKRLYKDMDDKEINVAEQGNVRMLIQLLLLTLIEIRSAKSIVKGVMIGEQSESIIRTRLQQLPSNNKGKGIIKELEKPTKKIDQIKHEEEVAQRLQAQMQAKLEEEDRLLEEDKESEELKQCFEIVPDDGDDVTIDATPLSTKSLTIVDYKIHKEGKKIFFQIIRVDDKHQMYLTSGKMLKNFNREDLEVL